MNEHSAHTRRAARGFTIVEAAITLAIMGVLAAIAVPRFSQAIYRQGMENAVGRLVSDLEYAATLARTSSSEVTITFEHGAKEDESYYYFEEAPGTLSYEVVLRDEPYRVVLQDGPGKLAFDMYGMPDDSGSFELLGGNGDVRVITIDKSTGAITRP